LAAGLPTGLRRGRVRPLGLDRYGVGLRVENDEGDHDVRLAFAEPVENATEVLHFVEARGLMPGAKGTLLDREPHAGALTLKVGARVVSVSHYIASNIYVV